MQISHAFCAVAFALSSPLCFALGDGEIYDPKRESVEAGFVDVDLHIDSMDCETWNACAVSASGTFQGRSVAIDAIIQAKSGQGRITYRSVGPGSDSWLQALATLYKLPRNSALFARAATADIVFLDANEREMAGKVFFAANGRSRTTPSSTRTSTKSDVSWRSTRRIPSTAKTCLRHSPVDEVPDAATCGRSRAAAMG